MGVCTCPGKACLSKWFHYYIYYESIETNVFLRLLLLVILSNFILISVATMSNNEQKTMEESGGSEDVNMEQGDFWIYQIIYWRARILSLPSVVEKLPTL